MVYTWMSILRISFNSQPPEGGWPDAPWLAGHKGKFQLTAARRRLEVVCCCIETMRGFNSQPPEGGWVIRGESIRAIAKVSTHSRPKAAGA